MTAPTSTTIIMPKLGESVTEGVVERWLKAEGDMVQREEPLVEISTDKVTAEVPSPVAGILTQILVQPGQAVPVESAIGLIETVDEGMRKRGDEEKGADSREEAARLRSTPLVRRLAAQYGIELSAIPGGGFGGRVRREDLQSFLLRRGDGATGQRSNGATLLPRSPAPSPPHADAPTLVPLTAARRIIAERLTQSRLQVPDATAVFEVDMTGVVRRRASVREEFRRRTGVDLTYLPFAVKAVTTALREYPSVNVSYTIEGILAHRDIHIGIAVAVDGGREPGSDVLVVPVLRHADGLSIAGIARGIHDLAVRARAGNLGTDDLNGATFTVNNTGAVGTIISTPIIPQPQAAIMTTEAIVKRPVVLTDAGGNDSIAIRSMMFACLTFDHRAFDGLTAGRFMGHVKRWLEEIGPTADLY